MEELTNQEESHNIFMHWLHNNPNNFSFWFPFVENLSLYGVHIPKSVIVKVPENIISAFFLEEENDKETILNWVKDSVKPVIDREFSDGPVFIKNGCFSNKFQFSRNCLVKERDIQTLFNHIVSIQYDSFCFDTCGNAEIVVREWIEPKVDLGCIYNGMPLRPELRVFYDFDKKEILYTANYWDWDYCHEGISRHSGDAETYKESYPRMLTLLKEYGNKWIPVIDQALSRVPLRKQWSVDFILEEDRPILIDMALAQQSVYWDPDKICRQMSIKQATMIEKTTKVFICEHCGKHSLSKGAMTNHEKACRKNPANMPMCENCRFHEGSFKTKKFRYPNPEYDPECGYGSPYISYEEFEETCKATGDKIFFTMSKTKQKTILSQSDWKLCPTMTEGCKHFEKR